MKNMKRIIAVVMAIAMIFALSATVFADYSYTYVTKVDTAVLSDSLWTKMVTVGNPQDVNFYAAIATDSTVDDQFIRTWNYFPYVGTQEQADTFVRSKVSATVTAGADKLASALEVNAQYITQHGGVNYYAARITAKVSGSATAGMIRINVDTTDTANTDCNFTIVVESNSSTPTYVSGINVELRDIRNGNTLIASDNGVNVYSANSSSSNLFYNDSGAAQTYATAGNVLDNLLADTASEDMDSGAVLYVNAAYGYVSSITAEDSMGNPVVYDEFFGPSYGGWMYGVLRTVGGTTYYVADSANIAAPVFELQSGDKVVWVYGTFDQMSTYFAQWPTI